MKPNKREWNYYRENAKEIRPMPFFIAALIGLLMVLAVSLNAQKKEVRLPTIKVPISQTGDIVRPFIQSELETANASMHGCDPADLFEDITRLLAPCYGFVPQDSCGDCESLGDGAEWYVWTQFSRKNSRGKYTTWLKPTTQVTGGNNPRTHIVVDSDIKLNWGVDPDTIYMCVKR